MKKLLFKTVMGLGLITSVIFTSCAKKSEDPKPNSVVIVTPPTTIKNDSLRSPYYILDNDTSLKFIEKYNGKTLKFVDPSPNGYKDTVIVYFELKPDSNFNDYYHPQDIKELKVTIYGNGTSKENGMVSEYVFFNKNTFVRSANAYINTIPWNVQLYPTEYSDIKIINSDILRFGYNWRPLINYKMIK